VARCHLHSIFRFEECLHVSMSASLLVPTSSAECLSYLDAPHPPLSSPPLPQLSLFLVLPWQCGCWLLGRLAYLRHRARRLCVGGQGRRRLRVTERHCAHRRGNVLVLAARVPAACPACCIVCRDKKPAAIGRGCHGT